jgi:hypothetical protein
MVEGKKLQGILDRPGYEIRPIGPRLDSRVHVAGACHLVTVLTLQIFDASGPTVTADVYVCNFSADHSAKARGLMYALVNRFQPEWTEQRSLDRGEE